MILAAGYGTRLGRLANGLPKGLLPVGGLTLIDRLVDQIEVVPGISETVLVTNDLFVSQFEDWAVKRKGLHSVGVISDGTSAPDERLGAVGDIAFAIRSQGISDSLFISASDCIYAFDVDSVVGRYREDPGNWIVAQSAESDDELRRGAEVVWDDGGVVTHFAEKPTAPISNFGACPLYVYERNVASLFEVFLDSGEDADSPGRFVEWLYRRRDVRVHLLKDGEACHDIGTPATYEWLVRNHTD